MSEKWPRPWRVELKDPDTPGGPDFPILVLCDANGVTILADEPTERELFEMILADHNAVGSRSPEAVKRALEWMEYMRTNFPNAFIGIGEGSNFAELVTALRPAEDGMAGG